MKRAALAIAVGIVPLLLVSYAAPTEPTVGVQQVTFPIDNDDLAGVVTGANGPEAGVWVIAETRDLPTAFAKIVVTDDAGRFLVPDLPKANYSVWVRGYGLVDSPRVPAAPGVRLTLTASRVPDARADAQNSLLSTGSR